MDRTDRLVSQPLRRALGAVVFAVLTAVLLFAVVSRQSGFLTIDSGPYLSVSHNLVTHGRPDSNFNFVGNFDRLPGPPNFIPPGLSLLIAPPLLLVRDPIAAAQVVLLASLICVCYFSYRILLFRTGAVGYAFGATLVLVCSSSVSIWCGIILTELPFIACMLGVVLGAVVVLEDGQRRWVRYLALPLASALLGLIRYIGVFLPPIFSVVYLFVLLRDPGQRRARLPGTIGYLAWYNLVSFVPLALWLVLAGSASPSAVPVGRAASLGVARASYQALQYLGAWLGAWIALAVILGLVARFRPVAASRRRVTLGVTETFIGLALVGYIGLLIVLRMGRALIPLDEIGMRYMAPAWPLAALFGALLFHALIWSQGRRSFKVVTTGLAAIVISLSLREVASFRLGPAFPSFTETYDGAMELLPDDAVVVCNYGQPLSWDRPDALVICIPSLQDWVYDLDLPELVDRHHVEWLVFFDVPDMKAMYPPDFERWLAEPPEGVSVARSWRYRDGVIYRLGD